MMVLNKTSARTLYRRIKSRLRDVYWDLYCSREAPPKLTDRPRTLLFLCQGNICRSPFAERFARRLAMESGMSVESAGIDVTAANPAPSAAVAAARQFSIEMGDHCSQPVNREMLQVSDLILVMEVRQRTQLRRRFPFAAGKIHLLSLFEDPETAPAGGYEKYNIQDPFGRTADDFLYCYQRISRCIHGVLKGEAATDGDLKRQA